MVVGLRVAAVVLLAYGVVVPLFAVTHGGIDITATAVGVVVQVVGLGLLATLAVGIYHWARRNVDA